MKWLEEGTFLSCISWLEKEREKIGKKSSSLLPRFFLCKIRHLYAFCQSVWNCKLCLEIKQGSLTNIVETSELSLLYRAWSAAYCTHLSITYHHLTGCLACALPCATYPFLLAESSRVLPCWNFTLTFAKMLRFRSLCSYFLPHVQIASLAACSTYILLGLSC